MGWFWPVVDVAIVRVPVVVVAVQLTEKVVLVVVPAVTVTVRGLVPLTSEQLAGRSRICSV